MTLNKRLSKIATWLRKRRLKRTIPAVKGILFIDWANADSTSYHYYFSENSDSGLSNGVTVSLSLEADTNAHTFTVTADDMNDTTSTFTYFRVRELFHARQFGDAHDTDDTTNTG